MSFLNRHPFPVRAYFEKSLVLGFSVPKASLADRIPECLELDLFEDELAFVAVAMVQTKGLRPAGFPSFLGRDFILIGYRIFVRYRNVRGRRLRGLYILGSETDKPSMRRLGGIFTQYRYEIRAIDWQEIDGEERVTSDRDFCVRASKTTDENPLPDGSPFSTWKEARRFAGPMPFTFSYDNKKREVIIVEGVRESWTPTPVTVHEWKIPFIDDLQLPDMTLANAFIVEQVPYSWKHGKIEPWTPK